MASKEYRKLTVLEIDDACWHIDEAYKQWYKLYKLEDKTPHHYVEMNMYYRSIINCAEYSSLLDYVEDNCPKLELKNITT